MSCFDPTNSVEQKNPFLCNQMSTNLQKHVRGWSTKVGGAPSCDDSLKLGKCNNICQSIVVVPLPLLLLLLQLLSLLTLSLFSTGLSGRQAGSTAANRVSRSTGSRSSSSPRSRSSVRRLNPSCSTALLTGTTRWRLSPSRERSCSPVGGVLLLG